jgi:hypothetical protein
MVFNEIDRRKLYAGRFLYLLKTPVVVLKKKNVVPWNVNKFKIEIELTTRCSLACYNCDRSVRQAPSNEDISIEQIKKFVDESMRLNWKWKTITLIGGEPTLHPSFFEVVECMKQYKDFNPYCGFLLSTNGYGKTVTDVLSQLPGWMHVRNSRKISNSNTFDCYNVAPIDSDTFKKQDFSKGCWICEGCGLGLSRYGFYPCGAGASIDRVFGFDIGLKKLDLVDDKVLRDQLRLLCGYCGHFKGNDVDHKVTTEVMSETWRNAYNNYKIEKPKLVLY